jgi:Rieske Fe-S protein
MTDVQTTTEPRVGETESTQSCACAHSNRRNVLLGVGAVGATAVLAACGTTGGANANGTDFSNNPAPAGSAGAQATGAGPVGTAGPGGTAGTFKAFSSVCPHAGCNVNKIDAGVISCPCHGSQFSVKDGSVITGPATQGLTGKAVKADGGNVVLA